MKLIHMSNIESAKISDTNKICFFVSLCRAHLILLKEKGKCVTNQATMFKKGSWPIKIQPNQKF